MTVLPALEHRCFVREGAGGVISPDWCSAAFEPVLRDLTADLDEEDVARPELRLYEDPAVSIYFCPFDYLNSRARVVLVGLTPGRAQARLALRTVSAWRTSGASLEESLAAADREASFAGTMRRNLVAMLDGIGLPEALGIDGSAELFDSRDDLVASTSAVCHPVFVKGGTNYGGTGPTLDRHPVLVAFARQVLAANLAALPDALVVPMGKAATLGVTMSGVDPARVLYGFPHPSGGNGHRTRQCLREREVLAGTVAAWGRRSAPPHVGGCERPVARQNSATRHGRTILPTADAPGGALW